MKTYYVGVAVNWGSNRLNLFAVTSKSKVPVSVKDLQSVKARNKKEARNNYLFAQL